MDDLHHDAVKKAIRSFLSRILRTSEVDDDADLFASGLVNSLFAMQLVLFIEKEYGITVANEDLDFANFRSLNSIAGFILRKKAA